MTVALILIAVYILGAFPTSYLVVRAFTGRDIRGMGSGNPGTMNVLDSVGWRAAAIVGLGDIGKGGLAIALAYLAGLNDGHAVLAGLTVVIGHNWSVFLRFDGGNGMGPAVGALVALLPLPALFATAIATLIVIPLRSRRAAGIIALIIVPTLSYILGEPDVKVLGAIGIILFTSVKIGRAEGFSLARPSR